MSQDPRPNIVIITTDQQRYDTLGVNGNELIHTPHLDALADRGTLFHNAIIQNPVCIPSRACLQTGRYTHQHGVRYMESVIDDTPGLPAHEITFMERLQAAGYHTAAFGKIHMMPEKGFHELGVCGGKGGRWTQSAGLPIGLGPLGRDYAAWLEARHPGGYEKIYEQRRRPEYKRNRTCISNVLPFEDYVDYWIGQNTVDLIDRGHSTPFFVWCGFCGPHGPIDPPRPYDGLYPIDDVPLPPNYQVDQNGEHRATTPEQDLMARRFVAYYWGLMTLIDDMVGRIVAALERTGQLDNTLILFTSDHGEMAFDFGRLGKGNFLDPVIRVPLIVVPPGEGAAHQDVRPPASSLQATRVERERPSEPNGPPGPRGGSRAREVSGLVETFDVAPTILDYASAEVPADMSATSLRPLIEAGGTARQVAVCEYETNNRLRSGVCVRTDRYAYSYWAPDGAEQFYDLESDPHERTNLAGDPGSRDELDRHRRLLIDRMMCTGNGFNLA